MFKRIVMQVSGLVMVRFTAAYIQLTTCLLKTAKHLLALITQTYLSVLTPLNLLRVQIVLSFKAWAANPTTAAQLTKHVLTTAKHKLTQLGLQLQTTVRQILQRATTACKKSKGLVEKMRLVLSHISESKTALIHTVRRWIQAGLKLLEVARQHLKRVQHRLFKGR